MATTAASFLLQAAPWVSLDVRRGSVADVQIPIKSDQEQDSDDPQECLVWQFVLQEYDIGFQLLENDVVVQDLGRFKAKDEPTTGSNTSAMGSLNQMQLDALEPTVEGSFDDVKRGAVYTLRWDNSYSLVRHKQVQYRLLVASKRVVAAAELAVQESQSRSQRRARRAAAGLPLPYLSQRLASERAMTDEERQVENGRLTHQFEQAVVDIVSIFTSEPDSPLHEGAARPFILAMEAVLLNGIKEEFLDVWPEAPYYEFLLDTPHVLRDDLGIVAEVLAGEPPLNLQYLGWNRSRSFLFLAMSKGILHRAFENLTKRRALVEKYYDSRALLYKYEDARKLASFLSALNGVKFLFSVYPKDECDAEDREQFPRNLIQCAPQAPLHGNEILFQESVVGDSSVVRYAEGDPDDIKFLENCTVPRYMLHGQSFEDVMIGRSSTELFSFPAPRDPNLILLGQLRVYTQDILVSITTSDDHDLTEPLRLSATDGWVELIVRVSVTPTKSLAVKLDNSYSMVRTKQVQLRCMAVDAAVYSTAWAGCLDMAKSISWKHVSMAGSERCAKYMESVHEQEEHEVTLQRKQDDAEGRNLGEDSILGLRSSLLAKPVSYFVGGLLPNDDGVEACNQCLTPFSFFSRQHECPSCKRIVCVQCSRHYTQINGKGPQLKVCDGCFIKEKDKERNRAASMKGKGNGEGRERPEYTALRRDPAMEKYFKMLSFGVMPSGVAQKMTQDEMPPETIAIFEAGPEGRSMSPTANAKRERAGNHKLNRRDSTFRKVYWTSLETEKANQTIWARVTARRKAAPITLSTHDFQELKYLFGNPTDGSPSAKSKDKNASKKHKFSALDSRRSNSISIGLNQFKAIGGAEAILEALRNCDFEFLTADRLTNLLDIAPNSVEVKRYTNFRGSRSRLDPPEKFLVDMCEISRVTEKINAMLFTSQFEHQVQELCSRIQVITQACYEVLHSERLARCFELVLAIGNLLNTGTDLEGAQGVTLSSLLKLSETKAVDQSMTLLQFIIKLIHDRGEGDVLLFINDLGTLSEAKRFSNVICDSQTRALQHEITKLEQEIKEDMVEDLKVFNKAEALRKRRYEEESARGRRAIANQPPKVLTHNEIANGMANRTSEPHRALLNAIQQRSMNMTAGAEGQDDSTGPVSINPHAAMLAAIRNRGKNTKKKHSNDTEESPRAPLLSAIRAWSTADGPEKTSHGSISNDTECGVAVNGKKLSTTQCQTQTMPTEMNGAKGESPSAEIEKHQNGEVGGGFDARPSLLAAIKQRHLPLGSPEHVSPSVNGLAAHRSSLLASIQQRGSLTTDENGSAIQKEQKTVSKTTDQPQAALLAAIRQRARKSPSQESMSDIVHDSAKGEEFVPRQYKMKSKFISIMRERLMTIKASFEDIEIEMEILQSAWEGTARYLAEDPVGSSSEYVFGLLNRFLLDVKVAKTLLFRQGLSFANDANSLLPHAHVGSTVATKFGPGVITALRVTDKRIEIKFPWCRDASLVPSCILSVGSLVRCRRWGVGIIRETCYDAGFCDVRFSFGFGKIRVEDLNVETSSNQDQLRLDVLRNGFLLGDPVVTPFGCGHVQSIRAKTQSPYDVLSVGLLSSESDAQTNVSVCMAVAYVSANRLKRKY